MFEVKKPEIVNRTFRMPKDLIEQLGKISQQKNVSMNQLIIQCCQYALENMSDEEYER